jgi:glutamate racemase
MSSSLPIGVFDSGIGGLTVLKALTRRLPGEDFLYLGDTARLPYGTKTAATVERYAQQAVYALVRRGVKAVVVACNTASAAALTALAAGNPGLPIIGVIEPGAAAAVEATRTGRIGVIATEGTVRGGAYQRAIQRRLPGAQVTHFPQRCSLRWRRRAGRRAKWLWQRRGVILSRCLAMPVWHQTCWCSAVRIFHRWLARSRQWRATQ